MEVGVVGGSDTCSAWIAGAWGSNNKILSHPTTHTHTHKYVLVVQPQSYFNRILIQIYYSSELRTNVLTLCSTQRDNVQCIPESATFLTPLRTSSSGVKINASKVTIRPSAHVTREMKHRHFLCTPDATRQRFCVFSHCMTIFLRSASNLRGIVKVKVYFLTIFVLWISIKRQVLLP